MPHRLAATTLACCLVAFAGSAQAQELELPDASPKARVDQRVGLTDFQLDYSSPGVKKRVIWGGLVPYGQLWRTGANAATKLTASRDFQFGGTKVKAGSYAIYTIPGKTSWTILLNTKWDTGGTGDYDKKNDVARITVKPVRLASPRERLTFLFTDTVEGSVSLDLEWERLRVRIPIKVDTKTQVLASIEQATDDAWVPHFASARYLLDSGGNLDRALGLVEKSIAIKRTWWNHWVKAQILGKKGRKAEAVAAAQQAQALGKGNQTYEQNFKGQVDKAIQGWR